MQFLNSGDLIVTSNYSGNITFIQNTEKSEYVTISDVKDGTYFLARFNLNPALGFSGDLNWVLPMIAFGTQNVDFCLDLEDSVYLTGTYQNKFRLGYLNGPGLTSTLVTDMFLVKVRNNGGIEWLRSSDKESSSGAIRAKSITFNLTGDSPRVTILGQFNSKFKYTNPDSSLSVECSGVNYNTWIGQFDLFGNVKWLISPEVILPDLENSYVDGYQIIWDALNRGNLYITGVLIGEFKFNVEVGSTDDVVYVAEISPEGRFTLYNYLRVDLPKNQNDWYPHLSFGNKLIVSFFGWGDLYFNGGEIISGNGLINLYINSLNIQNNTWGEFPIHVSGNVVNPSNNIITNGINIYTTGTYILSMNNTNGFIRKYLL